MFALAFVGKLCSLLFFFLAWWFYKPPGASKSGNAVVPAVDLTVPGDKVENLTNGNIGNGDNGHLNGYCNSGVDHTEHL